MDAMQRLRFTHLDPACKSCTCRQIAYNPCVSLKKTLKNRDRVSGRAARDVNLKQVFFSCQTFLFFFVFFTSDKANSMLAVDFCTCLFIKQPKYAERFRSPESSWAEPPQHYTASAFLNGLGKCTGFFFFITPSWFVLIVQTTCIQYQARAVINFSWWEVQWATWSSSMLNTVWVRHQARRLISVCRCPSRAPSLLPLWPASSLTGHAWMHLIQREKKMMLMLF